jgi:hypothetical protein
LATPDSGLISFYGHCVIKNRQKRKEFVFFVVRFLHPQLEKINKHQKKDESLSLPRKRDPYETLPFGAHRPSPYE